MQRNIIDLTGCEIIDLTEPECKNRLCDMFGGGGVEWSCTVAGVSCVLQKQHSCLGVKLSYLSARDTAGVEGTTA